MVVGVAEVVAPGLAPGMQHVGERHERRRVAPRRRSSAAARRRRATARTRSPGSTPRRRRSRTRSRTRGRRSRAATSAGPTGHGAPAGRTGNTCGSRSSRAAVRRDSTSPLVASDQREQAQQAGDRRHQIAQVATRLGANANRTAVQPGPHAPAVGIAVDRSRRHRASGRRRTPASRGYSPRRAPATTGATPTRARGHRSRGRPCPRRPHARWARRPRRPRRRRREAQVVDGERPRARPTSCWVRTSSVTGRPQAAARAAACPGRTRPSSRSPASARWRRRR